MAVQGREVSDQEQANSSFYLAKCILRSSVVLQAVYGHIRSSTTLDIVFGKETSLELVVLSEDGIVQSICEQPVFGKIKDMKVLPWNEYQRSFQAQTHGKDLLVITSDSGKMSFLTFCVELHRFLAVAHVQISQPGNARRELGQFLAVESRGRAVAVSALEDRIAIYPTSIAAGSNIVDKSMIYPKDSWEKVEHTTQWATIWSMAFVPGSTDLKLKDAAVVFLVVLLHRKGAIQNELLVLVCDTMERSIQLNRYNPILPPGPLAYSVIDVPDLPGFVFLFRCNDILLLEISSIGSIRVVSTILVPKTSSPSSLEERKVYGVGDEDGSCNEVVSALLELVSRTEDIIVDRYAEKIETESSKCAEAGDLDGSASPLICAWTWNMNAYLGGSSLMLSIETGELFLLQLSKSYSNEIHINLSNCLYNSPPLKCLLWMKGDFIAALAEMGDGQVLHFQDGKVLCRSTIENISPILDFSFVDYHNEKQDHMFACAGAGKEGSLRVIRNGVSVEKLVSTKPLYKGVTGCWTMKFFREDDFHAFLVLSFVEETRVLSVGLSFNDVTDSVGFQCSVCTLACGWIEDGWVAQVCNNEVRVCAPTRAANSKGLDCLLPLCTCWVPDRKASISLGAVSYKRVVLAMSQPGLLLMLGLKADASGSHELVELQQCKFEAELSCISIPQEEEPFPIPVPPAIVGLWESNSENSLPRGIEVGQICIVGTHKPSVEVLSMVLDERFSVLAECHISLVNTMGTALSGCVPEDVRLVLFDRPYILSGLRNGMLLRFEWPTNASASACSLSPTVSRKSSLVASDMVSGSSGEENITWRMPVLTHIRSREKTENAVSSPTQLHLIAVRRVGVSPVSLVPLQASLRADVIALGDRPWLLQTTRHSQRIACTSISFQPSTYATPVRSNECMKGILFVADCSLHLVEMEHSKRLNVQRLSVGSTARRIAYHVESKTLLVMRSEWCDLVHGYVSDICCIDPVNGALMFTYGFDYTEVPKCMQLCKIGNEHLLLVGTGLTAGKAMMASGEPDGAKGRLLVFLLLPKHGAGNPDSMPVDDLDIDLENFGSLTFAEGEGLKIILRSHVQLPGVVLAVAPYLNKYILACAGNSLSCLAFSPDALHRLKRYDSIKTRFVITCLSVHLTRIAVGDCRDGILFYMYHEYESKFEQLYCDPAQRLVADCALVDLNTALVTDRSGNFSVLSCASFSEENSNPERNLVPRCWYHMGEVMFRIQKGSLAYKLVMEDSKKTSHKNSTRESQFSESSVVASTLLGSVVIFVRLTREEYELLDTVQSRLAMYPLTAPVLGNSHALYRGRGCPAGVYKVLDGDMLGQFLELTSSQQQSVLADQPGLESSSSLNSSLQVPSWGALPVEQVLRLLELVHSSLT